MEVNLKVKLTIDLYNPVIRIHAELGSVTGIQDTLAKMAESGIPPAMAALRSAIFHSSTKVLWATWKTWLVWRIILNP